jgi:AcrR family transcriptional regulator
MTILVNHSFHHDRVPWSAVSEVLGTKGERTRARLLEVAVRRFAADGFRRTSVAAVAEEAGVTPAAVYAYFPGKEGLFEAAVDADAAALISEASEGIDDRELVSGQPLLLPALMAGLEHHRLARRVLAGQEQEVIDRLLSIPALLELRNRLSEAMAAGQEAGLVRPDVDPKAIAIGLETLTLALLMAWLKVPEYGDERQRGVEAVFEAVLRPHSPNP